MCGRRRTAAEETNSTHSTPQSASVSADDDGHGVGSGGGGGGGGGGGSGPAGDDDDDGAEEVEESRGFLSSLFCKLFTSSSGIRLVDCVSSFCESEPLVGRDQYMCDTCKRKTDADKTMSIVQLPDVLCVHLKRFNYSHMWGSKVSTEVSFPLTGLDMAPFLSPLTPAEREGTVGSTPGGGGGVAAGAAAGAGASKAVTVMSPTPLPAIGAPPSSLYDLVSVVQHIGSLHGAWGIWLRGGCELGSVAA